MTDAVQHAPMKRLLPVLTVLALLSSLVAVALALLPGPLYAAGAVDLMPAFSLLLDWAPVAAAVAVAIGFAGVIGGALLRARLSVALAAIGVLIGVGTWFAVDDFKARAAANPLHDVTANLEAPPSFSVIAPRQYEAGSAAARAASPHPDWRAAHAALYRDLETLILPLSVSEAASRAGAVARDMGWSLEVNGQSQDAARIEATDRTGWFAFADDIVVTIVPRDENTVAVDVRSVSRIGIGDVGKNAAPMRDRAQLVDGPVASKISHSCGQSGGWMGTERVARSRKTMHGSSDAMGVARLTHVCCVTPLI